MTGRLARELDRGWERLEAGRTEAARRIALRLEGEAPGEPQVLLFLAACAREQGRDAEALARLREAARVDPEWAVPEIWTAEILAADPDRLREARDHAAHAVALADEDNDLFAAVALKAGLEIDLEEPGSARKTLAEIHAPEAVSLPPTWAIEFADLLLAAGDAGAARRRFQALVAREPALADAWHGLGLAAERMGDEGSKRKAWIEVLALDQRAPIEDPHMSERQMAEVAAAALAELPEHARALLENVPIVITDLPSRADVEQGLDPRLLGLFEGTPHPDVSHLGGGPQIARILLFRKNLERITADRDELRDEIRTTLLHETGHFFGMSEDDLADVGLD